MIVMRMEHPIDKRGPFWPGPHRIERPDMDKFMIAVKGKGLDGQSLDGHPNERCMNIHVEVDEAYAREDMAVITRFEHVLEDSLSSPNSNTPDDLIFGMVREKDFNHWFPALAKKIAAKYGYKKAVYEVPDEDVAPLYTQAVWKRRDAKLVEYRDLV